ncbi:unnamed protein product, partial [Staurois parvus]
VLQLYKNRSQSSTLVSTAVLISIIQYCIYADLVNEKNSRRHQSTPLSSVFMQLQDCGVL